MSEVGPKLELAQMASATSQPMHRAVNPRGPSSDLHGLQRSRTVRVEGPVVKAQRSLLPRRSWLPRSIGPRNPSVLFLVFVLPRTDPQISEVSLFLIFLALFLKARFCHHLTYRFTDQNNIKQPYRHKQPRSNTKNSYICFPVKLPSHFQSTQTSHANATLHLC